MSTQWFYLQGETQCGPLSSKELVALAQSGQLTSSHMIWKEGLNDWIPAGSVSGLFKEGLQVAETPVVPNEGAFPVVDTDPSGPMSHRKRRKTSRNAEPVTDEVVDPNEENTTKLLRQALFVNPVSLVKTFFVDIVGYFRTVFKQARHPAFSVKSHRGKYLGDIALVKKSVSVYLIFVGLGAAIDQMSTGPVEQTGVPTVVWNVMGMFVFFITIWSAMWVGRIWRKWTRSKLTRRQVDQMFVYESCLIFSLVLPLVLGASTMVLLALWMVSFLHPFYMFIRIHRVTRTSLMVRMLVGGMLAIGFSFSFLFQGATTGKIAGL